MKHLLLLIVISTLFTSCFPETEEKPELHQSSPQKSQKEYVPETIVTTEFLREKIESWKDEDISLGVMHKDVYNSFNYIDSSLMTNSVDTFSYSIVQGKIWPEIIFHFEKGSIIGVPEIFALQFFDFKNGRLYALDSAISPTKEDLEELKRRCETCSAKFNTTKDTVYLYIWSEDDYLNHHH